MTEPMDESEVNLAVKDQWVAAERQVTALETEVARLTGENERLTMRLVGNASDAALDMEEIVAAKDAEIARLCEQGAAMPVGSFVPTGEVRFPKAGERFHVCPGIELPTGERQQRMA